MGRYFRRGSRISARGGRHGIDDLIWDEDERFLTCANTDLQLFKAFVAILCLNGVEQPFKRHQCPFFLPLRQRNPSLRRGSLRPRGGRRTQRLPPGSAPVLPMMSGPDSLTQHGMGFEAAGRTHVV